MRSILNESDRAEITARVRSLSVSSTGRWGSMQVVPMLQHLCLSARMTLGELPVPSANKRVLQVFPLKHLILYVFPFEGAQRRPLKPSWRQLRMRRRVAGVAGAIGVGLSGRGPLTAVGVTARMGRGTYKHATIIRHWSVGANDHYEDERGMRNDEG